MEQSRRVRLNRAVSFGCIQAIEKSSFLVYMKYTNMETNESSSHRFYTRGTIALHTNNTFHSLRSKLYREEDQKRRIYEKGREGDGKGTLTAA